MNMNECRPRLMHGAFNPMQVFQLIKCGIDLFDSSYASELSDHGMAFGLDSSFPTIINDQSFMIIDLNDQFK